MVRNMTLLFFFEKLVDKGEPRTLHDLSCQFGAKGFTKEMRQIAGGSQSGLKKFLSQYPSLFVLDGDFVYVNTFAPSLSDSQGGKRDYAQEAVEYFSNKLRQYGEGTEVPIESLRGHRSQASPEVRHISGQHSKEFKEFLCRFPEVFIVTDDRVILKEYENKARHTFHEPEVIEIDSKVTSHLISFFQHCLATKGPMIVDQLFHHVDTFFGEDMWSSIFKTSQDLLTFLKMHSNIFNVQSNLVTLVQSSLPNIIENNIREKERFEVTDSNITFNNNNNNNNSITHEESITTNSAPISPNKQSLKQRVNNLVLKTLAENSEKDRNLLNSATTVNGENWKTKILQSTKLVSNVKECNSIVEEILNKTNHLSLDCEGINIGVKGQITLFQIALPSGQAYIFDLITCPAIMSSLQKLLESSLIKVINLFLKFYV